MRRLPPDVYRIHLFYNRVNFNSVIYLTMGVNKVRIIA